MQFRVPQFIDIEDKILGPLTWKQAAYCFGAIGGFYVPFRFIDSKILAFIVAAPFVSLFLSMAFVRINNQSFVDTLEHAFYYYSKNNLYTWRKIKEENKELENIVQKQDKVSLIPVSKSMSLKDLAISLDTKVDNN